MQAEIYETLDLIRPALQADGGDIRVVEIHEGEGIVDVELLGACGSCPMSTQTLKAGVERIMRDRIPGLNEVRAIGIDLPAATGRYDYDPWAEDDPASEAAQSVPSGSGERTNSPLARTSASSSDRLAGDTRFAGTRSGRVDEYRSRYAEEDATGGDDIWR